MKFLNFALILSLFAILASCGNSNSKNESAESDQTIAAKMLAKAQNYFKPLPAVSENKHNLPNAAKIKLGKILYFDKQLSKDGNISCNSCHNLNTYGVDNLPVSPGDDGTLGTRNSPTVFNASFHIKQFWDGRAQDVEEQAVMPITNPIEMGMPTEKLVLERISGSELYKELFASAFPEEETPINYKNVGKAIGAFERTLLTPSKFDEYLVDGKSQLTNEELNGMQSYISSGCIACHKGKLLGGDIFWKFGLFANYWELTNSKIIDKGKAEVTQNEADNYIFKVPSLRNIEMTFPYFHDGSVASLADAIRIMGKTEMNMDLNDEEIEDIISFLKTLTADIPEEIKEEPAELKELYTL